MKLEETIEIQASAEVIWNVITDIEGAANRLSGINKVEILHKPENGLEGLKWKETRTLMGKEADETMWITESKAPVFYKTEAHNHGMIYTSEMFIEEKGDHSVLGMSFLGEPQTFGAKIMGAIMNVLMKKSMRKMIRKDLGELKSAIENV